jgi:hypothetical protein
MDLEKVRLYQVLFWHMILPTAQELHGCKVSLFLQAELVEKQSFPTIILNVFEVMQDPIIVHSTYTLKKSFCAQQSDH